MDANKLYKQIVKQEKREARIAQLELILTIVTTMAITFLAFAVIAVCALKYYELKVENKPTNPIVQKYV